MARKEPNDSGEKEGLSARIRELISKATVEERRNSTSRKKNERRRRTDLTAESEKKAS